MLHSPEERFTDILETEIVRLHYHQQTFMCFTEVASYFLHYKREK